MGIKLQKDSGSSRLQPPWQHCSWRESLKALTILVATVTKANPAAEHRSGLQMQFKWLDMTSVGGGPSPSEARVCLNAPTTGQMEESKCYTSVPHQFHESGLFLTERSK